MKKNVLKLTAAVLAFSVLLTGCSGSGSSTAEKVDLNSMTLEEITAKAKEEGEVNSVGMPDDWANWDDTWQGISDTYGLKHTDVDLSSAEELAMFEAEKNNATKDIGDVGETYGAVAEEQGLTLKYKTSYWDEIPDWAKDDDGDWVVAYYGTMALLTNKKLVPEAPTSFQDLLEGDYMVSIGDVARSTRAQYAVLAAAYAMGGDESNIQPGLDFFRQLAEQGRLDKGEFTLSRIEKGEIGVAIIWDFVGIGYREQIKENNPGADFEICIPEEGSVQSGYTTIINAYTQRPHAAALTREYILSDEGQLNLAKGYAKTVRDIELPADLQAKMIPDEQYQNIRMVEDADAWEQTVAELPTLWNEQVMAYAK
ncbi:ABC transporter substrate-binding protein [Eubacterium sp. An3]|uniref:ABC transporter substrate-binding protein n=1 Tax=Eubacterium sp. An3 TaxID=1965628 RepID=UPI000B375D30|nr:ABC transporter substrate-binding protein [Eubacterium sp. An3]OUO26435.1 ABC transporter substrate-binding protein [Eubacterium sp. An3]